VITSDNDTIITLDCIHTTTCTLLGTTQVKVTNGSARFSNLRLNTGDLQTGVIINATASPALPITAPAQSNSFDELD